MERRIDDPLLSPDTFPEEEEEHECTFEDDVDCDICPNCKEHSGYCSECDLWECCG